MATNIKKKWTKEEDKILIKEIKETPENLKSAFQRTGKKIGRTTSACMFRWYGVVSKMYNKDVNSVCFAIYSSRKYGVNRKNVSEDIPVKHLSIWQRILKMFKK